MKDFILSELGAIGVMIIDEAVGHYFNNPDIIPHNYKWGVPFIVIALVYIKRLVMIRMVKKA